MKMDNKLLSLALWMHPYSLEDNIFDMDGIFPDINNIDEDDIEDTETLANLLIQTYIIDQGLEMEPNFRQDLINKLENDWDRLMELKDIVPMSVYLKGKNKNLYHASDTKFEDPLDDEYKVDKVLECVYYVGDKELLHFGDIGNEVVYGPEK